MQMCRFHGAAQHQHHHIELPNDDHDYDEARRDVCQPLQLENELRLTCERVLFACTCVWSSSINISVLCARMFEQEKPPGADIC